MLSNALSPQAAPLHHGQLRNATQSQHPDCTLHCSWHPTPRNITCHWQIGRVIVRQQLYITLADNTQPPKSNPGKTTLFEQ